MFSTPFICFWGRKQNCGVEKNLHIIIFILSQIYYDLSQDKNNLSLCVSLLETFINILLLKSKRPNVVRIVERRVGFCYLYYISLHKKSKCFIPFLHLPSILLTSSYIHSPKMATCRHFYLLHPTSSLQPLQLNNLHHFIRMLKLGCVLFHLRNIHNLHTIPVRSDNLQLRTSSV